MLDSYQNWSELYDERVCNRASAQPAAEILRHCVAIGKLRSTLASLASPTYKSAHAVELLWLKTLQEAEDIDRRLEEWECSMTGRWLRKTAKHNLSGVIEVTIDFYSDIQVGKIWNQYRCARIVLHEIMIAIWEKLLSIDGCSKHKLVSSLRRSVQVISTLLSAICDSIPFHLQRINSRGELVAQTTQRVLGGEHLLWPLDLVFHSRWSTDSQRSQARKALEEIGTCFGLRQASKSIQLEDTSTHKLSNGLLQVG